MIHKLTTNPSTKLGAGNTQLTTGLIAFLILSLFAGSVMFFSTPANVLADQHEKPGRGLLPECGEKGEDECGYVHLEKLVVNVINFLFALSTIIAAGVFAYAGLKLITSRGNPSAKDEAKKMLMKVVWGFIIILSAWILVYTVTNTLLHDEYVLLEN